MTNELRERFRTARLTDFELWKELAWSRSSVAGCQRMAELLPFAQDHLRALESEQAEREHRKRETAAAQRDALSAASPAGVEARAPLAIEGPPSARPDGAGQ